MTWSTDPPSVCVLTTAWNQTEKTLACLQTATQLNYPNYDIVMVDNGSTDGCGAAVARRFPQLKIITSAHNRGFAGGFNLGLRAAVAAAYDYVFLINNDTLLDADCLTELVSAAQNRPKAGLLTAKIYYAADRKRIWSIGGTVNRWLLEINDLARGQLDTGQWETPRTIDFAPLCGVLLNTLMLTDIGMLDESFFLYYEDMEFCHRLRDRGYTMWLIPQAKMWHEVSASSGGSNSGAERYWMALSSGLYFSRHAAWWQLPLVVPYRLASAAKTTRTLWQNGNRVAANAYWRGLWYGWIRRESKQPTPTNH